MQRSTCRHPQHGSCWLSIATVLLLFASGPLDVTARLEASILFSVLRHAFRLSMLCCRTVVWRRTSCCACRTSAINCSCLRLDCLSCSISSSIVLSGPCSNAAAFTQDIDFWPFKFSQS
ncbi:hypothetical protein GDO81_024567 [Engystomops pustulosus]|uniref:Secreted protein n=1 Tax=Engystomops pustulosus TaxID=76066 RepID=A0AAV6YTT7_ENGPU|nr:hypothetical protein GDO81_024567 [Engystomops pustulosus]